MGFEEIPSKGYKPKKGDISVLPQNEVSSFGHIAISVVNNGCRTTSKRISIQIPITRKRYKNNNSVPATVGIGSMCGHHQ